jgi:hypothetical protein
MGALTSKPYAFSARPWELETRTFYDRFDSAHSPIELSIFNGQISRITPLLKRTLNDEWISDRVRFGYDASAQLAHPSSRFGFFGRRGSLTFHPSATHLLFTDYLLKRFFGSAAFQLDWFSPNYASFFITIWARQGYFVQSSQSSISPSKHAFSSDFSHYFIVGLSLRYTHPTYFASLCSPKLDSSIFEVGEVTRSSNFSLGSGLASFLELLRFKNRPSMFLPGSAILTSVRLAAFNRSLFSHLDSSCSTISLPEEPFAHISLSSCRVEPSSRFFFSCASTFSQTFDFFVPSPSPYHLSFFTYLSSGKALRAGAPLPPLDFVVPDDFGPVAESDHVWFPIPFLALPTYLSSACSPYFAVDHFFGFNYLSSSRNMLLAFNQINDYQQSHFRSI